MQSTNAPAKLTLPFANSGSKNAIPVASQIGVTPGAASLTDGFPPLNMTPLTAGGVPPSGLDMNGILFDTTAALRWYALGAGFPFDGTFAGDSNIAGYPKGARVMRSDGSGYWLNTIDGNTVDPESVTTGAATTAGWVPDTTNGIASITMTNANVTMTPAQYGKPIIVLSGTLTANLNLIFPNIAGSWILVNNCTGAYTVTCKTASGTGVSTSVGMKIYIFGDATNIYYIQTTPWYAVDTGTANAYAAPLVPAISSYVEGLSFALKLVHANTGASTLAVNGLAAKALVMPDGSPTLSGVLLSGMIIKVTYDGTSFQINSNVKAPASQVLWVRSDGSDSNDGSANSAGHAFLTIQGALNAVASQFIEIRPLTIQLGIAGTYAAPTSMPAIVGGLTILGDSANQDTYIISGTGSVLGALFSLFQTNLTLYGVTLSNTGTSTSTIIIGPNSSLNLEYASFINSGGNPLAHLNVSGGGSVFVGIGCKFKSGMGYMWLVQGGSIYVNSNVQVIDGLTWATACIEVIKGGLVDFAAGVIFVDVLGSAPSNTGTRYIVNLNGVLSTNSGGASFVPGSTAGSTATGGQYA